MMDVFGKLKARFYWRLAYLENALFWNIDFLRFFLTKGTVSNKKHLGSYKSKKDSVNKILQASCQSRNIGFIENEDIIGIKDLNGSKFDLNLEN